MGETRLARHMFLWCLSAVYMFAFASVYVQIPGLYGNEGLLPARWMLRVSGKSVWEQLTDSPTLLWFGPRLGLDTQQCMELLSLSGALLSLAATAIPTLRDCRVYLVLWMLYLSLYQVGQVFLYFQWDNLLLEVGFLAILVAPMNMPWGWRLHAHDNMTFWLVRWLLFRLMFASGVVKLTSRCPTWWGLTAVTYHYETQCIPTPLAWFAHQLPVWFQKLSVVGTYVIEIGGPFLFFSPIRRHRLTAFYMQVLLQVLIILSGNYNFFNLLTIVLCFSLLDDEHVNFWLCRRTPREERTSLQTLLSRFCLLVELAVYALLAYWTFLYFDLKVDWDKKSVSSKTAFTHFEFNRFLKLVTVPSIWIGVLSLTWEIVTAKFKSACLKGVFWRLWSTVHWAVFAVATASMFAISLVPYTFIEYEANSNIWPGVRKAYEQSDRYQLVNSYGLFRRMTGVGGRPEVVIEGSMDGSTWIDKPPVRRASETWLPRTLKFVGDHVRDVPAPLLLWTLFSSAATVCLVNTLCSRTRPPQHSHCRPAQPTSEQMAKKEKEERKVEKKNKNMNIKEEEDEEEREKEKEEEDAEGEDEKDKTKEMVEEKGKDDDATNEEDVDVSEENEEDDNDEDEEQTSEEKDHVRKRK
ncbi:lipase maturation factor 2a isoform X2 [Astyanax mexicanus]|uniref:lipase maturation factor 2a isoform X2 n=1 Tax=Astyanax mexicanus TaxID=7994 RepID=UPI0020CAF413|nr:lipase maturation factor 2a isoform X2 [Astyanax mexicanus]